MFFVYEISNLQTFVAQKPLIEKVSVYGDI